MNRSQPLEMRIPLALLLLAVAWPSSAWATGSLTISLQDDRSWAIEGTVTAQPEGGGQAHTCSTRGGRCSIMGLTAGRHQVTATLVRGGFVPPARVTIVDGRATSVRLTAQAASVPTTTQTQQSPTPSGGTRPGGTSKTQPSGQSAPVAIGTTTAQVSTRNLGVGQHASVLGTTQDQRGRRVEGTVTVTQNGHTIGAVSTTGGSFTVFDLSPGTYSFMFTALTGQSTSRNVTVASGAATSVRLSVTR